MNWNDFLYNNKGKKAVLITKKHADKLALDIDDVSIFDTVSVGEYFSCDGIKVFTNSTAYLMYIEYLNHMGVQ